MAELQPVFPPARPEFEREVNLPQGMGDVERPLTIFERIYNLDIARKAFIVLVLALAWELYARSVENSLIMPTLVETLDAMGIAIGNGVLFDRALYSLRLLLTGFGIGLGIAVLVTIFATVTRIGTDFLETLTAMFSPLPAIALLPLALLWFGLGEVSILFVLVHSVLWPVSLNMHSGFKSVSPTMRMVGGNYGLRGLRYVSMILIPAAFPSILTGMKIGWAFAWRTLIAAELVFGVSSGSGGLGWFIFENKNTLDIPFVFAGLLTVILIGLLVENLIFQTVETRTVRRWGMQS